MAHSARKVYIATSTRDVKAAQPVHISASAGEGVQIVDNPDLADEVVAVHIGSNAVTGGNARRVAKAARKSQERQLAGKKDKGAIDQILRDLQQPQVQRRPQDFSIFGLAWRLLPLFLLVLGFLTLIGVTHMKSHVVTGFFLLFMAPIAWGLVRITTR